MRLGLRGRILLLVLVALAPPTVTALVVALQERDEARVTAQEDVFDTTRLVAADVERVIGSTATFLAAVSEDLARRRGRDHCQRLLALVPRATDRYSSVGVAGPRGTVFCGATANEFRQPMEPVDVSGTAWFRAAQGSGGFYLGDFGTEPLSNMGVLMASHPIRARPGERPSVLFAALDVRRLADATGFHDAPRDTTFVLLDHRGTLVARAPAIRRLIGRRLPERPLVEIVLSRRRGTAEVKGLDGVRRIQGFAPVGGRAGKQLFMVAGRESATVFADPNSDLRHSCSLCSSAWCWRSASATWPRSSCCSAGPRRSSMPRAVSAPVT